MSNKKPFLWGAPQGEIFIFNNEVETKLFWSKLNLPPEVLEEYGVIAKCENDEYVVEIDSAYIAPIFSPNPYFKWSEEMVGENNEAWLWDPCNLTLDKEVWTKWPMIMVLHRENSFDRNGDAELNYAIIHPLEECSSVQSVQEIVNTYQDTWINNRVDRLEHEKRLKEHKLKN